MANAVYVPSRDVSALLRTRQFNDVRVLKSCDDGRKIGAARVLTATLHHGANLRMTYSIARSEVPQVIYRKTLPVLALVQRGLKATHERVVASLVGAACSRTARDNGTGRYRQHLAETSPGLLASATWMTAVGPRSSIEETGFIVA